MKQRVRSIIFLMQQGTEANRFSREECTTLVVAHRLTTIRNALKIVLIEKLRIVEEEQKSGKYWEMSNGRVLRLFKVIFISSIFLTLIKELLKNI